MGVNEDLKALLNERKGKDSPIPAKSLLGTGSTLLNLACSGRPNGGYPKGKYVLLAGESESGKTWLAVSALAEAAHNPKFKGYRLICDDTEDGVLMDLAGYFGEATRDRVEPPAGTREEPEHSATVEQFYDNVERLLDEGKPFVYVLDSMDSLSSEADDKSVQEGRKARARGKESPGSMSLSKPKENSRRLRTVRNRLKETGSILIIIAQLRDTIGGFVGWGTPEKSRGGGHALRYYAHLELWTSIRKRLKTRVKGKEVEQGMTIRVKVKKNRITGSHLPVDIDFYHNHGIDDIGSCVKFLQEWNAWKTSNGLINTNGVLDSRYTFDQVVQKVAGDEALESRLFAAVSELWGEIDEELTVDRKPRYQ